MDKLNLLSVEENMSHIERHIDPNSTTPGSKALKDFKQADEILRQCQDDYRQRIEKEGNPGRIVYAVQTDRPIGTDAVMPLSSLTDDAKGMVFSMPRDIGTDSERNIPAVLIDEKDMPKTNVSHVVYGPYGPTGNAGIYTMMFGDEAMPFPNKERQSPEMMKQCQEYWDNHVFLVTEKEVKATVKNLRETGRSIEASKLDVVLKKHDLEKRKLTYKSPYNGSYRSQLSQNAVKLNVNLSKSSMMQQSREGGTRSY